MKLKTSSGSSRQQAQLVREWEGTWRQVLLWDTQRSPLPVGRKTCNPIATSCSLNTYGAACVHNELDLLRWVRARPLRVPSWVALRLRCGCRCGGSLGLSLRWRTSLLRLSLWVRAQGGAVANADRTFIAIDPATPTVLGSASCMETAHGQWGR